MEFCSTIMLIHTTKCMNLKNMPTEEYTLHDSPEI